ncbi:hypothetical protein CJF31_00007911 [Rutstroemia sp. NJR-2017a BVV2]|jgi:putative membrane protein
MGSR